jgi:dethiobiotin synthetase
LPKRIFITATNTDIGKTYATLLLIEQLSKMGLRVGVYKPIETGVNGLPADGTLLLKTAQHYNAALKNFRINDIVTLSLPLPAAPYIANKAKKIDLSLFDNALAKIEKECDIVLIEGAGGMLTPIDNTLMMIDLAHHFNATTLLITHCNLGCINDTLLNLALLEQRNLKHLWAFNCRDQESTFMKTSAPYFNDHFDSLYFLHHNIKALALALLDKIASTNTKESACVI